MWSEMSVALDADQHLRLLNESSFVGHAHSRLGEDKHFIYTGFGEMCPFPLHTGTQPNQRKVVTDIGS